jgi:hypothetical protein
MMFNSLFASSSVNRRRPARLGDEIQLALLRQIIRLSKLLNRAQGWIAPLREYYWVPVLGFLVGMMIGLVMTTIG